MVMEMAGRFVIAAALLLAVAHAVPHHGNPADHVDHGDHADHGDHGDHADRRDHHMGHGPQVPYQAALRLSPPNADFAFALYKGQSAKVAANKNIFYSPLGISTALSMLSVGARADTHSQLFAALGYSGQNLTQKQVNEAYENLIHLLGQQQESQKLELGNALAVRNDFVPAPKFVEDIKHYYSGESFNVDFNNTVEAVAKINDFISKKTMGKITEQLKDLDADTAMVLINYVSFKGAWQDPFDSEQTAKKDFQVDETTKVTVDMMKKTGRYDFYQDVDNHTRVIMLPYKGKTSMMIVLPDEGKMKEVEGYLSSDYIRHWHDSLFRSSVELHVPKFSISTESSLGEILKEMGVINAFTNAADLSGMSADIKLKVSKVSHKAVLSMDEKGTEADAVTTVGIMPMSLPETMELNRPFLVLIVESSTRSILFMGRISDPTAA